ncbi:MAG: threonine--tRNA ligase [Caldilineaceae bacterium]
MNAYEQLIQYLNENHTQYRLIDHAPEGRTEIVSQMRGNQLADAAKCIVVMVKIGKKETRYVLAVVPGDCKVDLNAIKALYDGTYVAFATQEIAEQLTGCAAGTILPFSFNPDLPVIVDPAMVRPAQIYFNAARLDQSMVLQTEDYKRLGNLRIERIAAVASTAGAVPQVPPPLPQAKGEAEPSAKQEIESVTVAKEDSMSDNNQQDQLYKIRHSLAHVMAQAVLELYPEAKIAIGPPIDTGFYYDFDLGRTPEGKARTFSPEDLEKIEKGMRRIIAGRFPFHYRQVSGDEARQLFADQPYKLDLIAGLEKGGVDEYGNEIAEKPVISTYKQDSFEDLCRGPHVEHTGQLPPDCFKLTSVAGAYWRGDEKNPMLQRIYGTAFRNKKELNEYLALLEEAKKRDHRKLGRELEIFIFDEEIGPGLPLWLPNGTIIAEQLEQLAWETERDAGYQQVRTPHLTKEDLFLRSGHLPYYSGNMYPPMELDGGQKYYVKPMNCPFHHKIFNSRPRSYRELPVRLTEYGTCYRYEDSGTLFGLMRVRSMQMNDAHIYCAEEQFEQEFMGVVGLYLKYFKIFGVDKYRMRLSLHHPKGLGKKYVDNAPLWQKTEEMVRNAMRNGGVPFFEVQDEAAFYGPKIDVEIFSAIGREFTLATNQVDFAVPSRFDLKFTNSKGEEETPLCIHRAPLGTHERFIGFLIEHYGGAFPVWLAPQQVAIIPITAEHNDYAASIERQLYDIGVRANANFSSDRMNAKIRAAQLMKVPYMLVVGDQERANNTISLRRRDGTQQNDLAVAEFMALVKNKIASRAGEL